MADLARPLVTVDGLDSISDEQRAKVIDGEIVYEAMTSFNHGDAQSSLASAVRSRCAAGAR